jgi:hypothetical protein
MNIIYFFLRLLMGEGEGFDVISAKRWGEHPFLPPLTFIPSHGGRGEYSGSIFYLILHARRQAGAEGRLPVSLLSKRGRRGELSEKGIFKN